MSGFFCDGGLGARVLEVMTHLRDLRSACDEIIRGLLHSHKKLADDMPSPPKKEKKKKKKNVLGFPRPNYTQVRQKQLIIIAHRWLAEQFQIHNH